MFKRFNYLFYSIEGVILCIIIIDVYQFIPLDYGISLNGLKPSFISDIYFIITNTINADKRRSPKRRSGKVNLTYPILNYLLGF